MLSKVIFLESIKFNRTNISTMEDKPKITICRICINEIETMEKCFNIFMKYQDILIPVIDQDDILIVDKINALANVNIKDGDGLPSTVCGSCILELEDAYKFKRKCEKSDDVLRFSDYEYKRQNGIDIRIKEESDSEQSYSVGDRSRRSDDRTQNEPALIDIVIEKFESSEALNDTNYLDEETSLTEFHQSNDEQSEIEEKIETIKLKKYRKLNASNNNSSKKVKGKLKFKCEYCDTFLISECKLRVHLKTVHSIYPCPGCKQVFKTFGAFRYHRRDKCKTETFSRTQEENIVTPKSVKESSVKNVNVNFDVKPIDKISVINDDDATKTDNQIKPSRAIDLKLECHDCGQFFKSKCKMRVHWKKMHRAFTCSGCKRDFKTFKAYKNHQRVKSKICRSGSKVRIEKEGETFVFYCKLCIFSTKSRGSMVQHFIVHNEATFQCDQCPKIFNRKRTLTFHKESVHNEYKKERKCSICHLVFLDYSKLKYHSRIHKNEIFQCDICKKTFKEKEYLKNHLIKHTYKKTFPCDICNKLFYTKNLVAYHKTQWHRNETHCCSICGYTLLNRRNIALHEKKHTDCNIACNLCGKFFENSKQMSLHMERHVNKTKLCVYCNKSFYRKKYLSQHIRQVHKIFISRGDHLGKSKGKTT